MPALILLAGGFERRWIGDDGFINLRVVRQLLAGNGFVFNAGERVEAVTSPLWVLVLSGFAGLGMPIEHGAVWLGLTLTCAGLLACGYASAYASADSDGERPAYFLPFGTLAYAAIPAAWDYASSGLENGLGLFWLGLSALMTARSVARNEPRVCFAAAFCTGLGPLVRPDYALLGLPLGVLLVFGAAHLRQRLAIAAVGSLPGLAYQVFRMGYFAALVPNTAFAKEAFQSYWEQGGRYVWNTVHVYQLLWPLACLALGLALTNFQRGSPRTLVRWALLLGGLLHGAYIARVGGDFMHARLLLPSLAAVFSALGALPITSTRSVRHAAQVSTFAALLVWAGVCITTLRVARDNEFGIGDERGWFAREAGVDNPIIAEDYRHFGFYTAAAERRSELARGCPGGVRDLAPRSRVPCQRRVFLDHGIAGQLVLPLRADAAPAGLVSVVVVGPLGIPAEVLGLRVHVVDAFGLADPIGARVQLGGRGRPGHEKRLPDIWMAARYAPLAATRDAAVREASEVLECEPLDTLAHAVHDRMTPARFWKNMAVAFRLHHMRFSTDPRLARDALCAPRS